MPAHKGSPVRSAYPDGHEYLAVTADIDKPKAMARMTETIAMTEIWEDKNTYEGTNSEAA